MAHVLITRRAAQRVHGDVQGALQLPPLHRVDLLLQLGLLGHQRVHVGVRIPELRRHLVEAVEQRLGRGDALHDVAEHVLGRIELRLLRQEADARAVRHPRLAREVVIEPGHDAQQRRLAGAVDPEHADLGARQKRQRDVLQDLLAAREDLGQTAHHVDVLIRSHATSWSARAAF